MRALHLFSNYKWTGPAEPAVALAAGLAAAGEPLVLRSSGHTKGNPVNHVAERARARGLRVETDLQLRKHRSLWHDALDARRLRRIVVREGFDLVHCHLPNDTRIAARGLRGGRIPWLRTLYECEPDALGRAERRLLREGRRVFVFSRSMLRALLDEGFAKERLVHLEPGIDLARFRPDAPGQRATLGLAPEHFVAGIVARVQPQRRFDLLLDVAERLREACPEFRLVIIGRGSKLERVAREPARRRGLLGRNVLFPGYFEGEAYPEVLRSFDVKLYLVPGSDGTARAVREAMACGVPVLATRRGMLPELIHDRVSGRVLDETPEAFAAALLELARDRAALARMGDAARREALARFDPARQVAAVRDAYRAVREEAA